MFRVLTSSDVHTLAEHLAGEMAERPLPPLERETIVVQTQGLRRWIILKLADRLGCAASLHLPFPAAFCNQLAEAARGETADQETRYEWVFGREALTWRVLSLLENLPDDERFGELRAYLSDDDERKRHQLALRIAGCFDDYQMYRPDLLLKWETDAPEARALPHASWQRELWRQLCDGAEVDHLARRLEHLRGEIHGLRDRGESPDRLPPRVSVFAVSALPPAFIELLQTLGTVMPVTIYALSSARRSSDDFRCDADRLGNRLSRSLGTQEREFFSCLKRTAGDSIEWIEQAPAEGPRPNLLHVLQEDILNDVDRGAPGGAAAHRLQDDDESLQVHVCHSPLREMEVLRDRLLDAFARDRELRPQDVLVLVPDIGEYAPYIQAVFGVAHDDGGAPQLPYTIADRTLAQTAPLAETLLDLLRLTDSRLSSTEVLSLLDCPAVCRAAGIADAELPVLRNWVRATNIRWAADGQQRKHVHSLPEDDANTWRAGLDRLLLGYGVGQTEDLVAGILPCSGDTLSHADLLGSFSGWLDAIFARLTDLRQSRPLSEWARALLAVTDELFECISEEEERALGTIRHQLANLEQLQELSGFEGDVCPAVVLQHLEQSFANEGLGSGFINGLVTFCALRPMRSIPFPVIAICGLGSAAFPRQDRPPAFDLQAREPRAGDRSARSDDRQVFLESLMAAEKRLIISFVGRSQKDNRERAPSVCLSELLDYVDQAFTTADGRPARERITTAHRLQPFSRAYFDGSDRRLFSFSKDNCPHGWSAPGERARPQPFAPSPLPATDELLALSTDELIRFWFNPCRHFCEGVLRLRLRGAEEELEEVEPYVVDSLSRYGVRQEMVEARARGDDLAREEGVLAARGALPPAKLGRAYCRAFGAEADAFIQSLGEVQYVDPIAVELRGEDWVLVGQVGELTEAARVQFRCAKLKPKDRVRAWISHLVLNAHAGGGDQDVPRSTRLVGEESTEELGPLDDAMRILDRLMNGYRKGACTILPFFELSSYAFVEQGVKLALGSRSSRSPLDAARAAWESSDYSRGDDVDPYIALCCRDGNPLDGPVEGFEEWADTFWKPYLELPKEVKA